MREGAIDPNLVCVAEIVAAHGIKGMVRLKIYLDDPDAIWDYMPLCDSTGENEYEFEEIAPHKNVFLATVKGIDDRNESEKLQGIKLYIHKDELPDIEEEGEYYYNDLIGMVAIDADKNAFGKIINVVNFGASDLLEVMMDDTGKRAYVQFDDNYVPHVDIKNKQVTVIVPEGLV